MGDGDNTGVAGETGIKVSGAFGLLRNSASAGNCRRQYSNASRETPCSRAHVDNRWPLARQVSTIFCHRCRFNSRSDTVIATLRYEHGGERDTLVYAMEGAAGRTVTDHEPVPSLKWPTMNMTFEVESPDLLKDMAVGQKVQFSFVKKGSGYVITQLGK